MTDETNDTKDQAAAQYSSIIQMLAAVNVDYARLEELRDERAGLEAGSPELAAWDEEFGEELSELEDTAGDCGSKDDARQRIDEDPLEIQVRSGWSAPGSDLEAEEFMILLCTGGPAVRIVGELSDVGEPHRAWMEYQDWGTPWTQYFGASSSTLCEYASHFFGG